MSKNLSNSQFDEADSAYYTEFNNHLNNNFTIFSKDIVVSGCFLPIFKRW